MVERTSSLLEAFVTGPRFPDDLWQGHPRPHMPCQYVAVHDEGLYLLWDHPDLLGTE